MAPKLVTLRTVGYAGPGSGTLLELTFSTIASFKKKKRIFLFFFFFFSFLPFSLTFFWRREFGGDKKNRSPGNS